jgi:hypothetical protein
LGLPVFKLPAFNFSIKTGVPGNPLFDTTAIQFGPGTFYSIDNGTATITGRRLLDKTGTPLPDRPFLQFSTGFTVTDTPGSTLVTKDPDPSITAKPPIRLIDNVISLTSPLPVKDGGTGKNNFPQYGLIMGNNDSSLQTVTSGPQNSLLTQKDPNSPSSFSQDPVVQNTLQLGVISGIAGPSTFNSPTQQPSFGIVKDGSGGGVFAIDGSGKLYSVSVSNIPPGYTVLAPVIEAFLTPQVSIGNPVNNGSQEPTVYPVSAIPSRICYVLNNGALCIRDSNFPPQSGDMKSNPCWS